MKDENNRYAVEELHTATSNGEILGLISIEKYMKILGNTLVKEDDNPIVVILK